MHSQITRMDHAASANENGQFFTCGTAAARDVYFVIGNPKAATGVGSVVKVTSTTHASEANKIGAISD
jgi:hypothetical protein